MCFSVTGFVAVQALNRRADTERSDRKASKRRQPLLPIMLFMLLRALYGTRAGKAKIKEFAAQVPSRGLLPFFPPPTVPYGAEEGAAARRGGSYRCRTSDKKFRQNFFDGSVSPHHLNDLKALALSLADT